MFNLKDITRAISQIASEKGLEPEAILNAIEASLAAAYKKEYRKRGEIIKAKFNPESGELKFWQVKTVVDLTTVRVVEEEPDGSSESKAKEAKQEAKAERKNIAEEEDEDLLPKFNSDRHIMLDEAKKLSGKDNQSAKIGDELNFPLESHDDFGRIAAQTAKQVILQQLREAEKNAILSEFENKEGEIVSGVVQRFERGNVYVDLGRAIGVMFGNETIPGEHYKTGERLRFYVIAVQNEPRLPSIILSRAHPQFVGKLFEMEVPEISDGIVQIKAIAREPGSRTKIAVSSVEENIDPVGSCLPGQSLVLTEDFSYQQIAKLAHGQVVMTHAGNLKKITRVFKRKWAGSLYRFNLFGIYKTLDFTGEHPILFAKNFNSAEEFMPASEVFNSYKKGGFVAIPTLRKIVADKTIHHFERQEDFLWVLGMYLAEGSLDVAETNFTLAKHERDKAERIKSVMERYGAKVIIQESECRPSVITPAIMGHYWREIFKELGGEYCDHKRINPRLLFLNPKLQMAIFNGWADGDGHRDTKRKKRTIVTTSEALLWQMYHILLRNNIRGNMQQRKERPGRKTAFVLEVAEGKTRDYRGFFRNDYYFSRVRAAGKVKIFTGGLVYNLEVENDNSFIVASAAVHNCVGQRGTRVMAVNNELGNEKIDIIEWQEEPEKFVANSLSPARVTYTEVSPRREIRVFVPEDQLSLAIGRGGQNVRLAAKLTGWKIDVRSQSRPEEVQAEGVAVAAPEPVTSEAVPAETKETKKETDK